MNNNPNIAEIVTKCTAQLFEGNLSEYDLPKLLLDNGFTYSPVRCAGEMQYNITNISILKLEHIIDSISVGYNKRYFILILLMSKVYDKPNHGIDPSIDMSGYEAARYSDCDLYREFNSEDDFMKELYRLDSIGLNTKSAIVHKN